MKTAELLEAWREATRAAELARRLARAAADAADQADERAASSAELAALAERAAEASSEAARTARAVATDAAVKARTAREDGVTTDATVVTTSDDETVARDAYHRRVDEAAKRARGTRSAPDDVSGTAGSAERP
ncbi:MAG TPA: hypothetical protein VFI69_07955 [Candidatus Limnocylindrales bacterium]|nr:hypothetical protein [Candidatus Limnocylindrales bacterium]